jgi:hypothetical protein
MDVVGKVVEQTTDIEERSRSQGETRILREKKIAEFVFKSGVCDSCFQVLVTGFLPQEKGKINLFPVAKIL